MSVIETVIPGTTDYMIVKAFCYGLSSREVRLYKDAITSNYVLHFTNGEDAMNFKLKELDKKLLEILATNVRPHQYNLNTYSTGITTPIYTSSGTGILGGTTYTTTTGII